ncbi:MAG TPA: hypothetical protein VEL07_23185, partial [Planctomycetota bacterium]|nr:hypothetical protein [Planctomycetota bacterium]
ERLAAVGECLRWYPYEEQFYRRLEQIASADATATTAVHDEVRARLAIRAGQAEASGDGPPRTVEAAARHALTALSAIRRGGDCAAVPDLIDGVARRYGHDPNVVNLVLEALATSPDACAQRLLALSDGWRLAALPTAVAAVLIPHYATTTDRARRLAPLLQRLYPDEWTRAGAGDAAGSPLAAALVPVRAAVEQR